MMTVKAIKAGYFRNIYRWPGDLFRLDNEQQFSSRWMEKVKGPDPEPPAETVTSPNPSGGSGKRGKGRRKAKTAENQKGQEPGSEPSSGKSTNESKEDSPL